MRIFQVPNFPTFSLKLLKELQPFFQRLTLQDSWTVQSDSRHNNDTSHNVQRQYKKWRR